MDDISAEELARLNEIALRSPQEALALLREYEERFQRDMNFWINSGGLLIDIGSDLAQPGLVQEGIFRLESVVAQVGDQTSEVTYNLANGYSALFQLDRRSQGDGFRFDPDDTPLLKAKHLYRQALTRSDKLDRDLRAQLWVNYGNCLSGLGRAVEAMSAYERALRVRPDHPMAKGNLAIEVYYLAHTADHRLFLLDARDLLKQALSNDQLEQYGGPGARSHFEKTRQEITGVIAQLGVGPDAHREQAEPTFSSANESEYVDFCVHHHLFLNFCLHCRRCSAYSRDSLTFSLVTGIKDDTSFVRLARVINEVKERYVFARLLLFQALRPVLDTVPIDDMTTYTDNLDYAVYGVRVASLKQAFESAYNILDKTAHFLNSYLRLGVRSGLRLSFMTDGWIWREKKAQSLRAQLRQMGNWHLFGLYDLARDFHFDARHPERDGYWGRLRRVRNALTHEYLVPHVEGIQWAHEADDPALHIGFDDLVDLTVALLQLVRAAVIYLIAFVDREERKRRRMSTGLIVPTAAARYDPALFTPALDRRSLAPAFRRSEEDRR
jgi:tetratricopeptide (TPR) repeat protein